MRTYYKCVASFFYNIGHLLNYESHSGWLYVRLGSIVGLLVAGALFSITHTDSYAWVTIGAILLGLAWQQLAFIGHDLGHHVVTHERKLDDFISHFVGNLIQGKMFLSTEYTFYKCCYIIFNFYKRMFRNINHGDTLSKKNNFFCQQASRWNGGSTIITLIMY